MKAILRNILRLVIGVMSIQGCVAQVSTGTPPFGSFAGTPDVVNLGNLNAHWDIPVRNKAGRGTDFKYDLTYDNSIWSPVTSGSTKTWQPVANWGWQGLSGAGSVYASYSMSYQSGKCGQYGNGSYQVWSMGGVMLHDQFGVIHPFGASGTYMISTGGVSCPPNSGAQPSGTLRTVDTAGAGYILYYSINAGSMSLSFYDPKGGGISPPIYVNSSPNGSSGSTTDTNGNMISWSNGSFTDTLGQLALGITGSAPSNTTLSFANNSGGYSTYTVGYISKNIKTNFGCSGVGEYSASNVYLVNSITLPEGTTYQFTYEGTPGYSGYTTGRVASVKLPTGGTISYQYTGSNNGIECVDGSTAGLTRTTPDGATIYTRSGSGNQWTTTALAPAYNGVQDQTVMHFLTDGFNFYEIQRQVYSGTSTLLQTLLTCYEASDSSCSSSIGDSGTKVTQPITRVKKTTQLPGTSGTVSSGWIDTYDSAANILTHAVYDYASGNSFGSLLQTTTTTYSTAYSSVGIEVPIEIKVTDGNSNQVSDTKYGYTAAVISTSGTPSHQSGYQKVQNRASIQKWVSGSTYQTASYSYYDTGNINTFTDINGTNVATYSYSQCGNSFLSGVSVPVKNPSGTTTATLTSSATWNCVGGVPANSTDLNHNTTTYNYGSDPYWRPTSVTDAAGNTVSYSYPSSGAPNSSSVSMTFNSGTSVIGRYTTTDGLGRVVIQQKPQGAGSSTYDSAASSYDSRGRLSCSTSVPYSAVLGSYTAPNSANGNCRTYDALDRTVQQSDPGGGTVATSYNLNDATQTTGPAPSGENLKQRSFEYNGAGQIVSVCEITNLTGSASCGQNTAHTGYLTKYVYQGDRLIQTKQNAQATAQTRSIQYDGLGRTTSETIPEWSAGTGIAGTTNYAYDSDSTCNSSSTGDLIKTVDNASNVICRAYDSLHRVLSANVPSGTYSASTPKMYYVYDAAIYSGTAMQNAAGNLAEAYTMSGSTLMTDLFFSRSFSTSGATSGGPITQLWEKTPNSPGYYQTTDTYFPNGALGLRHTTYGVPDVSYGVDGEGRPKTATDTTNTYNLVTATSFNTAGAATSITYGNGDSDSFGYDSGTNRPTSLLYNITGGNPFTVTTNLTWNPNWSLQQMQIVDTNDSSKSQTCTYTADDLRRISSVNCGSNTWAQNFSYDAFGNINKAGAGNATSYVAAYSAITNQVSGGPSYDSNGNQLNSTGLTSISWNAAGVPVSVTPLSGGATAGTYDALGRLVETTSASTTRQFIYGSSSEKVAVMQGSALIKGTIVLPGGETALYNASSGPPVIRHKDWLGSSRLATTWAHGVQSKTSYAPFGETYNEAGTADRSFTGQDQDTVTGSAATGVYDYLFRKYDPAAGRWLSPDPYGWGAVSLDDPQSLNRYAYVENRPLDAIDPLGLVQCISSDNKTVQESGTNGCDNLGSGWNYFISTCSGPACNQPPAPTPPPTQPTPPTPPSPPVTCLTYGTCVQPGPNPTPGSGNQGGSGTSAPNGGQHLTPHKRTKRTVPHCND